MNTFDDYIFQTIKEMASHGRPLNEPSSYYDSLWNKVKHKVRQIDDFVYSNILLSIYVHNYSATDYEMFAFRGNELVIYLEYSLDKNNGIQMSNIWKSSTGGFYMTEFYINYLLDVYDYILSDFTLTARGFKIYSRLADDDRVSINIVDFNNGEEQSIKSSDDLKDYYGDKSLQHLIFKVQRNE